MKQVTLKTYVDSWWLPTVVFLLVAAPLFAGLAQYEPYWLIVFLALAGLFVVAAYNLFKKCWQTGISNLLSFFVFGFIFLFVAVLHFASWSDVDGFADGLTIPADIEITIPKVASNQGSNQANDAFQVAVLETLKSQGQKNTPVNTDLDSLQKAYANNLSNLKRYLATNRSWRVFQERGNVFATRRWIIGADWRYSLHGYYTHHDVDSTRQFQTRLTIGLSGKTWGSSGDNTTVLHAGEIKEFRLKQTRTQPAEYESHLIIKTGGKLNVEIFEQSGAKERRLTGKSLAFLEKEFEHLAANGGWSNSNARVGEASLELTNSFQPGIYDVRIWVNAGEAGMIYLKAFEITKGTPLSVGKLKARSNEWIGWSAKADELFFSNTHIALSEGDWGKPYAARFEVWFAPATGNAERKLLDRVFKVEGWQR